MNDFYSVFPKVIPVRRNSSITITGLQDQTIKPGESYKIRVLSMTNHLDDANSKITASPPVIQKSSSDLSKGATIRFDHKFLSHGEYSISIMKDDEASTKLTTERVYAVPADLAGLKPYKGDMHIHTYYSDGKMSPIYMAVTGRKLGLDFAAITDHSRYEPSLEAIKIAEEIGLDMLLFPGEEVDFPAGHIVSVCASSSVTDLKKDDKYHKTLNDIVNIRLKDASMVDNLTKEQYAHAIWTIDKIHELGGYAFLAHPYWVAGDRYHHHLPMFEQLIKDGDMDGIEVIGGYYKPELESNWLAVAKYYDKCQNYPVLGNSDTHYRSSKPGEDIYGWYWTNVFAKSLCKEDIFDAIMNKKCVACERPYGERFIAVGQFDLVEYSCFLEREFFPLHDRICSMEADIYMDMLMGRDENQLGNLKANLADLYEKSFPSL